jgi:hypothetical protein
VLHARLRRGEAAPSALKLFLFYYSRDYYCRFHLVCPGQKIGDRNFFWAWYKLKSICVLYFHFVPSPEKVSLAKFFPERGGGQTK